jgi:hypothetical protein
MGMAKPGYLEESVVAYIIGECLQGLEYLHSNKVTTAYCLLLGLPFVPAYSLCFLVSYAMLPG